MLGNFSFGEYFKKEAIRFAWDLTMEVFQFDPARIWVTVFKEDEEAFELWTEIVSENRIVRMDEKDNFWSMGETGPCGPCSELYYDRGPRYGDADSIINDLTGERYLEFWNLVFMEFNRDMSGKMTPLPKPSIDTGVGLERVVSLKMEVDTLFATDILSALIARTEEVTGKTYAASNAETAPAFHVIADHIRSLAFAIADGAQPSNVERGYVLRKLLRRAVRYGKILDKKQPFLAEILPSLIDLMGEDYPELRVAQHQIEEILTREEETFLRTLRRGDNLLNGIIAGAKERKCQEITGDEAFKLKDTYGLPLEEILLIAKDFHLSVNLEAYQLLEEEAREKSKLARGKEVESVIQQPLYQEFLDSNGGCNFVGYADLTVEAFIKAVIVKGLSVPFLKEGESGMIILDQTPFYPEKGGQVGDTGLLLNEKGASFKVSHCHSPHPGIIIHEGSCLSGVIEVGSEVRAEVDRDLRQLIQNNHTATHLLHWALGQLLGSQIRQAGSWVTSSRLRFDFNHSKPLSKEEIEQIEDQVNGKIRENRVIKVYSLLYAEAQRDPSIKQFFGDKYGDEVRVVDIGESKELCGGTHTNRTGTIGYFRFIKESSIAAGTRRIEAVTGKFADEFLRLKEKEYQHQIDRQRGEIEEFQHQLKVFRRRVAVEAAEQALKKIDKIGQVPFLATVVDVRPEEMPLVVEEIMKKLFSGILLIACRDQEKCQVVLRMTLDIVKRGVNAADLLKKTAFLIDGSGGGRPEAAQAGGKAPMGVEELFKKVIEYLQCSLVTH